MANEKKMTTYLMRDKSIQILNRLKKEINDNYNLNISKGEILELLLTKASSKQLAKSIKII